MTNVMGGALALHVLASLRGGAARQAYHLAQGLIERGWRVAFVAPDDDPAFRSEFETIGALFITAPMDRPHSSESWRAFQVVARERDCAIIHLHGHRGGIVPRGLRRLGARLAPMVHALHGYHPPYYQRPWSRWCVNTIERFLAPVTDAFLCVSPSTRDDLIAAVPGAQDRCMVIPNAVSLMRWSDEETKRLRRDGRDRLGIPEKAFVIGCVARLHWQKGVHRLIEAFAEARRDEDWLLLVGDGPEEARLRHLAERLGIMERCLFTGETHSARRFYPVMDLFTLPSLWEGLPLTVLEAWDAGTPVIAADAPGSRDVIRHGETGWLAEPSARGIADALRIVREQRKEWVSMIEKARAELEANYRVEKMVETTEALYRRVLERQ